MTEQREQFDRVRARIGQQILAFCRQRLVLAAPDFHADELRAAVQAATLCAPASADRILRGLRQLGALEYSVRNRRASLYHLEWVDAPPTPQFALALP